MAEKLHVVCDPLPEPVVEPVLARLATAHPKVEVTVAANEQGFLELVSRADGAFMLHTRPELIALVPRLQWLQSLNVSVEGVLTPEVIESEVAITVTKGPRGHAIAEHVAMFMLALARRLPASVRDHQRRLWNIDGVTVENPYVELRGKTILVMGVGAIGRSVARICKTGFQMRVLGFSRTKRGDPNVDAYVERADLNSAVAEADFVCLAMPATPQTEGIVDADAIAAMKSTAYLINIARGSIVDEAALVDALKAGRIAGAALDVLTEEPASEVNPFWDLPDVIITPHNSPMTDRIVGDSLEYYRENVRRFGEGEPLMGLVDKEAGY